MTADERRERRLKRNQETREANERRQAESKGRWPMTGEAILEGELRVDGDRAEIWL